MSVLVDDNDPLVQYNPPNPPNGWAKGGRSPEFDNTTHTSATPGDTAVLEFKGTSIRVYGTIGPNTGQSRLNFSIDGGDLESYQAPSVPAAQTHGNPNQLLWASPILNETSHHLVITVDNDSSLLPHPNSTTGTFFLDYFVYNTTAAVEQPLFDDSDASVIYSPGGWQSGNSTDCLESTQHVSASAESWAALSFNGTGISLVGTPSQPGFKASIVIDGSQPIISQFQDQNQQLFNTSGLTSGPHTINVTVLEGNLAIDYFMVTNDGPASSNPPDQTSSSSPGGPHSSGGPKGPGSGVQTLKTPPIAAIVGGAVGGLALLLLLLVGVLIRRRRTGHDNQRAFEHPAEPHPWAGKRRSVTSMTTLFDDGERPKNFEKERPASRYIYYE